MEYIQPDNKGGREVEEPGVYLDSEKPNFWCWLLQATEVNKIKKHYEHSAKKKDRHKVRLTYYPGRQQQSRK